MEKQRKKALLTAAVLLSALSVMAQQGNGAGGITEATKWSPPTSTRQPN